MKASIQAYDGQIQGAWLGNRRHLYSRRARGLDRSILVEGIGDGSHRRFSTEHLRAGGCRWAGQLCCTSLCGIYISTEKNAMAADTYAKFGEPVEPREVADGIA